MPFKSISSIYRFAKIVSPKLSRCLLPTGLHKKSDQMGTCFCHLIKSRVVRSFCELLMGIRWYFITGNFRNLIVVSWMTEMMREIFAIFTKNDIFWVLWMSSPIMPRSPTCILFKLFGQPSPLVTGPSNSSNRHRISCWLFLVSVSWKAICSFTTTWFSTVARSPILCNYQIFWFSPSRQWISIVGCNV